MSKSIKDLTEGKSLEVRNVKCSEPNIAQRSREAEIRGMSEGDNILLIAGRQSEFIEYQRPSLRGDRPDQEVARPKLVLSLTTSETDARSTGRCCRLRRLFGRVFALLIRRGASK